MLHRKHVLSSLVYLTIFLLFTPFPFVPRAECDEETPPYLRLALTVPVDSVNPVDGHPEIVTQLFAGLTEIDPETLQPVPSLVTHWEVSADGLIYTFFIRKDAIWSNGESLTAEDMVRTIRRYLDPFADPAPSLFILKNAQKYYEGEIDDETLIGVEARDARTLQFTLEHPTPLFPMMTAFLLFRPLPIQVIEGFEEEGEDWTHPDHIVVSGPYGLHRFRKEKLIILKKNSRYFDANQVKIEEVRYVMAPSSDIALQMYRESELDLTPLFKLDQYYKIQGDPLIAPQLSQEPRLETWYIGFQHDQPPMDNVLVRKAIAAAIDKKFLIEKILRLMGKRATTFTAPPCFGAVDATSSVGIAFDPAQARSWLAEAGFPGAHDFPELRMMVKHQVTTSSVLKPLARMLEHHLNIQVVIVADDELASEKAPHLFLTYKKAAYPDAHNFLSDTFHPDKTDVLPGWNNRQYAELLDKAFTMADQKKRESLYKQAEKILCEKDVAIVPLFFREISFLAKPRLNWVYSPIGGQQIRQWSFSR